MGQLTRKEITVIREIVSSIGQHFDFTEEAVRHLLLLFLGERPGILVTTEGSEKQEAIASFLDDCELLVYSYEQDKDNYFFYITNSESHLDKYDPTVVEKTFETLWTSGLENKTVRIGLFLGYPKEDVEHFATNGQYDRQKFQESVSDSVLQEYNSLPKGYGIPLPAPNDAAVERAIDMHQSRVEALEGCDVSVSDFVDRD